MNNIILFDFHGVFTSVDSHKIFDTDLFKQSVLQCDVEKVFKFFSFLKKNNIYSSSISSLSSSLDVFEVMLHSLEICKNKNFNDFVQDFYDTYYVDFVVELEQNGIIGAFDKSKFLFQNKKFLSDFNVIILDDEFIQTENFNFIKIDNGEITDDYYKKIIELLK